MRIKIDQNKCSGCHLCAMVCSLVHGGSVNTEKSAIRIEKDDLETSRNRPIVCRQCKEMECLSGEEATPADEKQKFYWTQSRAERCPFQALAVGGDHAYHCDLCGGKPQCVTVCTSGALHIARGRKA